MAVPFRKVSKTRKNMRRTHYKIAAKGLVKCSNCGTINHVSKSCCEDRCNCCCKSEESNSSCCCQ